MKRSLHPLGRAGVLILVALVLVAGACSSSDESDLRTNSDLAQGTGDFEAPAPEPGVPSQAEEPPSVVAPDDLGSGGVDLISLQTVDLGRDIIYTADLTVAVDDVASAGEEATTVIEALGGFLYGQQTTARPSARSVLTFKIPPENFQEALTRLGAIGELRTQNISADDVTERVVDLESRITTAEASVTRLRAFLEEAGDVETIAEIERELLNRETTLETLRGQLRTLQNQVALATIVLTLTEADIHPAVDVIVTTYLGTDDGSSCPGDENSRFVEGDDMTVCFEVTNTGDTSLTDFTVHDTVLEVELEDLLVVFGDESLLEPGQTLVLAYETTAERDLRTRTRVTAQPVNEESGLVVEGREVSTTQSAFISVDDPGGLPGFGDGISASWDLLQNIGGVIVLAAGAVLPFIWLIALAGVWLVVQSRRRKRNDAGTVQSGDAEDPTR